MSKDRSCRKQMSRTASPHACSHAHNSESCRNWFEPDDRLIGEVQHGHSLPGKTYIIPSSSRLRPLYVRGRHDRVTAAQSMHSGCKGHRMRAKALSMRSRARRASNSMARLISAAGGDCTNELRCVIAILLLAWKRWRFLQARHHSFEGLASGLA
jgi:hypothetical protein